jgi:hypothetical protein
LKRRKTISQRPRPHQRPLQGPGPPLPPHLQAALARIAQQPVPCLLCGRRPQVLGVFVPDDPQRWGVPGGWQGGCVYTLCEICAARPGQVDQVEALLWRERAKAVARWN